MRQTEFTKAVKVWLFIGVVMLFFQVVLGGITRITGSGLSITKWDIITGTLPPMTNFDWQNAFDLYKQTPQYLKINGGMEFSEFKFIYFWEYVHRLWARIMGFVFLIPFIYFIAIKQLSRSIIFRLVVVFVLSAITAAFGWIMVASGLMDRPWVNAYKLGFHLLLAFITYAYLLWTFFLSAYEKSSVLVGRKVYNVVRLFMGGLWLQIFLGGIVSGMKAGLFYNTWPLMGGSFVPPVMKDLSNWTMKNMTLYDKDIFAPSLVQFVHRSIAYILLGIAVWIFCRLYRSDIGNRLSKVNMFFIGAVFTQAMLGITIVLVTHGRIPVLYGVLHQMVAFILLGISYFMLYLIRKTN